MDDLLVLRLVERLIAVSIGGLAIWLGARLFLAVPDQAADGSAQLSLSQHQRVILTRIGPGVFFALFGTILVFSSFFFSVKTPDGFTGFQPQARQAAVAPATVAGETRIAPLDLGSAIQMMRFLNEAEQRLNQGSEESERNWNAIQFRNVKAALLKRAWDPAWGPPDLFLDWLREEPPRSSNPGYEAALAVIETGG